MIRPLSPLSILIILCRGGTCISCVSPRQWCLHRCADNKLFDFCSAARARVRVVLRRTLASVARLLTSLPPARARPPAALGAALPLPTLSSDRAAFRAAGGRHGGGGVAARRATNRAGECPASDVGAIVRLLAVCVSAVVLRVCPCDLVFRRVCVREPAEARAPASPSRAVPSNPADPERSRAVPSGPERSRAVPSGPERSRAHPLSRSVSERFPCDDRLTGKRPNSRLVRRRELRLQKLHGFKPNCA